MAKIEGTQEIPPALVDLYRGTLVESLGDKSVRSRYPYHIPHLQTYKGHPSAKQRVVRETFQGCCNCFAHQPATGGVEPPIIGPRDREWWFNQSAGSGLFYYDYFMQQSLDAYFGGSTPDWCRRIVSQDAYVNPNHPDTNYGTKETLLVASAACQGYITFIKRDVCDFEYLYLLVGGLGCLAPPCYNFVVGVYLTEATWNETSITYNNMPDIGYKISESEFYVGIEWLKLYVGSAQSVALLYETGSYCRLTFSSKDVPPHQLSYRPYFSV